MTASVNAAAAAGGAPGGKQMVRIEEIGGIKLRRKYDLSAPKGVNGRNSDNTLIQQLLNWAPDTTLRNGLERTYAWIYDQIVARERGDAGVVSEPAVAARV